MTARSTATWTLAALFGAMLAACGGPTDDTGKTPKADTLDVASNGNDGGLMKVGGKLFSIPSPVQTALLIRKLGLPYEKGATLPLDAGAKYTARAQRALALGIYGADLAYVTIHKDGQQALKTLQAIEQLSNQLEVSNAFDKKLVEGFKRNLSNEDSLLRFTGVAFRSADEYLKVNQRDDVSAAVLAGGWLESLYLSLNKASDKVDPALAARIGEQRHTLENLIALLESTDTGKANASLIAGLKDLLTAYQGVTASYRFQQPTVDAANKTTYINSISSATIAPEALRSIIDKVKAIRTTITA